MDKFKFKEILASLNELLEANPNDAFALSIRGLIYLMMGKYEKSLEIDTNNNFILRKCAKIYHNMGRYEESLVYLNKSLEIESNNLCIITIGEIYHMLERYKEALAYFNKSLEIEPNDAFELRNRSATFCVLGMYEEYLKKSLEIELNGESAPGNQEETKSKNARYYEALSDL